MSESRNIAVSSFLNWILGIVFSADLLMYPKTLFGSVFAYVPSVSGSWGLRAVGLAGLGLFRVVGGPRKETPDTSGLAYSVSDADIWQAAWTNGK